MRIEHSDKFERMMNENTRAEYTSEIDSLIIVTSSYAYMPENAYINSGVFVRDFARAIAEHGIKVIIVTQQRNTPVCEDPGIDVIAYPWSGIDRQPVELTFKKLSDLLHIWSLLREGKKAIRRIPVPNSKTRCLCMWTVPAGYMAMKALKGKGIPYDVWCLGSDIWNYGRKRSSRWLIKKILKNAQNLFSDGYGLTEDVQSLSGRNCTFLASSRMLPDETKVVPELMQDKPNLLFIGRWHPNKGVDFLPETMRLLKQIGVDAHLHIFGGGMLREDLTERISRNGVKDSITVHGYADSGTAVAYLKTCDVLIIPSRLESIPIIFSDAVKCGIPIVATEVGDLGVLIRKYQIGEVVQPSSPQMLAEGIQHVLTKDRSPFSAGALQAAQHFDVRTSAVKYLQTVTTPL